MSWYNYTGLLSAPDFVSGIITHEFYQSMRGIIPVRGVHNFIPTILMTMLQGCLLMVFMLTAGAFFASIGLACSTDKKTRVHNF